MPGGRIPGGYAIVKDHVRECDRRTAEMFVHVAHPAGHAQVNFGEILAITASVEQNVHLYSGACFIKA